MTATLEPPDILSPEFARDPYAAYRLLRDEFPLVWHEGMATYVISRYDDVQRAFKDPVFTSENNAWQLEPVHGRTILQMEGREHATHRALVAPAFRGKALRERFGPTIRRNSRELVDAFRGEGRVDLVDAFATRFPINVIVDMLGLPRTDHDRFHGWYTSIMGFLGNLAGHEAAAADGLRTKVEFEDYMVPRIRERRAAPGDDLLSTLCTAEIDGESMTDEEIKAFCSLLLTAGGETTDKAVTSLMADLVAHPEQLEAVRADRSLIPAAFAETLRFSPPVHMIMRQPAENVELSGGVVEAGRTVTCLIGAANRDERRFEDAEALDFSREPKRHVGFGEGIHHCIGAPLARLEGRIALEELFRRFDSYRILDGAKRHHQHTTRGWTKLPAEVEIG
jgi:cytochrome P450